MILEEILLSWLPCTMRCLSTFVAISSSFIRIGQDREESPEDLERGNKKPCGVYTDTVVVLLWCCGGRRVTNYCCRDVCRGRRVTRCVGSGSVRTSLQCWSGQQCAVIVLVVSVELMLYGYLGVSWCDDVRGRNPVEGGQRSVASPPSSSFSSLGGCGVREGEG